MKLFKCICITLEITLVNISWWNHLKESQYCLEPISCHDASDWNTFVQYICIPIPIQTWPLVEWHQDNYTKKSEIRLNCSIRYCNYIHIVDYEECQYTIPVSRLAIGSLQLTKKCTEISIIGAYFHSSVSSTGSQPSVEFAYVGFSLGLSTEQQTDLLQWRSTPQAQ